MYIFKKNLSTMNILYPIFYHMLCYDFRQWTPRVRHLESPFCHIKDVVNAKIPFIYVMYI